MIVMASAALLIRPHLTALDIPYGDGWGFASRAIELHGLLHSGQWAAFWNQLLSPATVTLLPTYALFWLLPTAWATGMTYGIIHTLVWHLLLWLGAWGLLRELGLSRLLPAVLLLTLANNNNMDSTLYYYMDATFAACALVALWLLVRALVQQTRATILAAGVVAGTLLLVKPGNTIIFLACYFVTVGVFVAVHFFSLPATSRGAWVGKVFRGLALWTVAFLPLFLVACYWTLIPAVVIRILGVTSSFRAGTNTMEPLLRLFYFPLCLSYFYSFGVLALGGVALWVATRCLPWLRPGARLPLAPLPRLALWSLVAGFLLVWGGFFSFIMAQKVVRSIPLMVPVAWIALLGWLALRERAARSLTVLALLYFMLAHAQFAWGVVGAKQNRGTEGYVLEGDWLNRLPGQAPALEQPAAITRTLLNMLEQNGITHGKVGVGTEMLYWNNASLNWLAQLPDLQRGRTPALEFQTLVDSRGQPILPAFSGATAFLLMVHPSIQYSWAVYEFNVKTAQYAERKWKGSVARRVDVVSLGDGQAAVVLVAFDPTLRDPALADYLRENFHGQHSAEIENELKLSERRYSLQEYWRMLRAPPGAGQAAPAGQGSHD